MRDGGTGLGVCLSLERSDSETQGSPSPWTHFRIIVSNLTASTATSYSRSMTMETIRSCRERAQRSAPDRTHPQSSRSHLRFLKRRRGGRQLQTQRATGMERGGGATGTMGVSPAHKRARPSGTLKRLVKSSRRAVRSPQLYSPFRAFRHFRRTSRCCGGKWNQD